MRTVLMAVIAAAAMAVTGAIAEPISNGGVQCFRATWVATKETDCDQACRRASLSAESITLSAVSTQKIFVCRHRRGNQYSFGTQGSRNCQVIEGGSPRKRGIYECLCVRAGCAR